MPGQNIVGRIYVLVRYLLTLGYRSHCPHEEEVDVEQLDQAVAVEYCCWPAALELRGPLPSAAVGSTVLDQNPA